MSMTEVEALEAAARAACAQGGFDPDEMMPNDGPRWRYYVPGAQAAVTAYLAAVNAKTSTVSYAVQVCPICDIAGCKHIRAATGGGDE